SSPTRLTTRSGSKWPSERVSSAAVRGSSEVPSVNSSGPYARLSMVSANGASLVDTRVAVDGTPWLAGWLGHSRCDWPMDSATRSLLPTWAIWSREGGRTAGTPGLADSLMVEPPAVAGTDSTSVAVLNAIRRLSDDHTRCEGERTPDVTWTGLPAWTRATLIC